MASKTLLLLVAAALTQAALGFTLEEFHPSQAGPRNAWPCPEEVDIEPCICTKTDLKLELDCSKVVDDAQLESVFKAHFPFQNFTLLKITSSPAEKRVPITYFGADIFQDVTFANIRISHTDLNYISHSVFDKSAQFLETFDVTDSFIVVFPFDVVDEAPLLYDLRVFKNNILHMPDMTSDSLTYLDIAYNPGLQYGDHAFEKLPNLENLVANDIELSHIAAKAFYQNTKLKYLDLSNNGVFTLYKDSLSFQSPIEEISLESNRIHTVEVDAISGLGDARHISLWLQHNFIETLDQSVWEPVFNSVESKTRNFVFNDNPFTCQCNILWLVSDADHRATLSPGTHCLDTESDMLDIDVAFLEENCATIV